MPTAIVPMKATLAEKPPRGDDWLFEVKWDGVRAVAFVDHEQVRLMSRTGNWCEKQYPELSVIHHYLAGEQTVLDGEDRGARRERHLALRLDPAAHRTERSQLDRAPGAVASGE